MPSNIDSFEMRLIRHFTAVELVEFLDIPIEDIVDQFIDLIYEKKKELQEEIE